MTGTVRTVTTNGIVFAVCSLSGNNDREGIYGFTLAIESINGREKGRKLSQVRGWVKFQTAIAVARSYSQMFHGARPPSPLQEWEPV